MRHCKAPRLIRPLQCIMLRAHLLKAVPADRVICRHQVYGLSLELAIVVVLCSQGLWREH